MVKIKEVLTNHIKKDILEVLSGEENRPYLNSLPYLLYLRTQRSLRKSRKKHLRELKAEQPKPTKDVVFFETEKFSIKGNRENPNKLLQIR